MAKKDEINYFLNNMAASMPPPDGIEIHPKKRLSPKVLRGLIRFHTRVLDIRQRKSSGDLDLALMLIGNLCNLKPPKKNIAELLIKSLRKLEKLNPLFLPLIIGKENTNFSVLIYTNSIKKNFGEELSSFEELKGNTIHFGNNKVMILLNTSALGFFSEDVFLHELLHVVDDMIVGNTNGKKKYFHELINKRYNNILAKTASQYHENQKKAHEEFAVWLKMNYLPDDHEEQVAILRRFIEEVYYKKYGLWAADEGLAEQLLIAKRFLGKEINNSSEVFAYALQYYMENRHRRKILKKRAPELYKLIKDVVLPVLKRLKTG